MHANEYKWDVIRFRFSWRVNRMEEVLEYQIRLNVFIGSSLGGSRFILTCIFLSMMWSSMIPSPQGNIISQNKKRISLFNNPSPAFVFIFSLRLIPSNNNTNFHPLIPKELLCPLSLIRQMMIFNTFCRIFSRCHLSLCNADEMTSTWRRRRQRRQWSENNNQSRVFPSHHHPLHLQMRPTPHLHLLLHFWIAGRLHWCQTTPPTTTGSGGDVLQTTHFRTSDNLSDLPCFVTAEVVGGGIEFM